MYPKPYVPRRGGIQMIGNRFPFTASERQFKTDITLLEYNRHLIDNRQPDRESIAAFPRANVPRYHLHSRNGKNIAGNS